jgi:hypothetical protein
MSGPPPADRTCANGKRACANEEDADGSEAFPPQAAKPQTTATMKMAEHKTLNGFLT